MKFILASASPRRIDMLKKWQFDFITEPSFYKEEKVFRDAKTTAMVNAYNKAFFVYKRYIDKTVIGADTVVAIDDRILGKPENKKELRKMLKLLSKRMHRVITGVAVIKKEKFAIDFVETEVQFRMLTDSEIETYVATNEGLDKAGGYAIQGIASSFIEHIKGPLDNVIGMPVTLLRKLLKK